MCQHLSLTCMGMLYSIVLPLQYSVAMICHPAVAAPDLLAHDGACWALQRAASWHAPWHCDGLRNEAEVECCQATCSDIIMFVLISLLAIRFLCRPALVLL